MKHIFSSLLMVSLFFTACKKDLTTDAPSSVIELKNARSVIGDTLVFKLGDTCTFTFDGQSDHVTFYSGAVGNQYDYRQRTSAVGATKLSFSSKAEYSDQLNTLKVLVTNKLAARDSASIVNAAWTDISSRGVLATSATVVNFGMVDITDLAANPNDSLFLAFKYSGTTGTTQRTWTITNLLVNNVVSGYAYNLLSNASDAGYWTAFGNVKGQYNSIWVSNTSALTISGGGGALPSNTSWIVSKPLYIGRVVPDVPTALVKTIIAPTLNVYNYKYLAVGAYKATFELFNTTADDSKRIVKIYNIKIIP